MRIDPRTIACFLFFQSCSVFVKTDFPTFAQKGAVIDERKISYELIGWQEDSDRRNVSEILKTLHISGAFSEISVHTKSKNRIKIQIILEKSSGYSLLFGEQTRPVSWMIEQEPGRFSLYLLNRIFSVQTFLLVPIRQKYEDRILFKVWKKNEKLREYSYPITKTQYIGWVSLGLRFFDDREEIPKLYSDLTKDFIRNVTEAAPL
ncbi:hypothetical protein EHQ12_12260 [Leptospira gomenensis]|uniref:Lipoprotein n=1 Tax=Leptospira gomenensis TaxID=2484974 RepID=A0A5F1Y9C7_9LEPT|nr:hypothetical protein [Leptospira gomenensis]TGK32707.1 hypothetical protein EHQ17_12105 [Leptospira gomenensis]TGK36854.1 hypothetical protein EHQ12_12260 [Leptospira gomenensis]TGK39930.1 hypothetical protein EHQ07_19560 [Leptospira gomenensis]TGK58065.1 hypothetical protein EHQ13_14460 [Leptospira gomenensis]